MKTVLITGATSGIGRQLAQDYASQGVTVVACGRNHLVLNSLAQRFACVIPLQFDITDLDASKQAISSLNVTPDLWVLNAGDCEYIDNGIVDAGLVKRVFDVNVIGLANMVEACQDRFQAGHRIAVIGSIAGEVLLPRAEAYGASKAAVSYFANTLRLALKPKGIEVTTVYPGFVKTPLTDKNTFPMPMLVTAEQASKAIRGGLHDGKTSIYFPKLFTSILRVIGALPYSWQNLIVGRLIQSPSQRHSKHSNGSTS